MSQFLFVYGIHVYADEGKECIKSKPKDQTMRIHRVITVTFFVYHVRSIPCDTVQKLWDRTAKSSIVIFVIGGGGWMGERGGGLGEGEFYFFLQGIWAVVSKLYSTFWEADR